MCRRREFALCGIAADMVIVYLYYIYCIFIVYLSYVVGIYLFVSKKRVIFARKFVLKKYNFKYIIP